MLRLVFANMKGNVGGPAIFIDRDGVINCRRADDYVLQWSHFQFMPGIREALKELSSLNRPMIVISNQSAVGRGLLQPRDLEGITAQMKETLLADGTRLAAAYYCTHKPDDHCICRKPSPELLYRAARDFDVDLSRSVFVGDSDTDVRAARLAGCEPVLFGPGLRSGSYGADWTKELRIAGSAKELFQVTVEALQAAHLAASVSVRAEGSRKSRIASAQLSRREGE
jgi:D-glycero-D-manno-heptose 1,7-bisphosphate phosphatase